MPDYSYETLLQSQGFTTVCGTDEVGRGPIAGLCTAAAVILDPTNIPDGLDDSKKLSKKKREAIFDDILKSSHVAVASVCANEIDRTNIRIASLRAMSEAINALEIKPDHVLVDGNVIPPALQIPATAIIKGDAKSFSIAAASIVAKVIRDRLMERADLKWPGYGFAKNAGYGSQVHLEGIQRLGPCPIHRMTFKPLKVS